MGPTCNMSRALPLGMSLVAGMSKRTMSPKSLSAIQTAQEAPTLPAPTTVILGRWLDIENPPRDVSWQNRETVYPSPAGMSTKSPVGDEALEEDTVSPVGDEAFQGDA